MLLTGQRDPLVEFATESQNENLNPTFAVDETSIDPAVFGLTSYASPTAAAPRVDRRAAIQVPAVKRSRDLIAGTLGTLPIDLIGPGRVSDFSTLFEQPERNVPRAVTMTRTFEDMFFEGVAWWRVTEFGWHNYPLKVRRLNPRSVTVDEDRGKVYVDGKHVEDKYLIRFDSPNDGLLIAGARAIRTCLTLDAAAQRYAEGAPPMDYLTPTDGVDPADETGITDILNDWQTARQTRSTAYIPAGLAYHTAGWNPEQLQLADARQHAVLEIARVAGIDAEELGVAVTSRTYMNQQDRRKNFLDFTLGGYRQAMEDRLSMGDVSPRGYVAKFNLSAFLRSDDKTRMETYEVALRVGALTEDEIRELEDKQPLTPSERPALRAVPTEETVNG